MLYKGRTLVVPVNIFDSSWTAGLHVAALEGYLCMVLLKEIIRHKRQVEGTSHVFLAGRHYFQMDYATFVHGYFAYEIWQ